jgi:hypothetical protein
MQDIKYDAFPMTAMQSNLLGLLADVDIRVMTGQEDLTTSNIYY